MANGLTKANGKRTYLTDQTGSCYGPATGKPIATRVQGARTAVFN